MVGIFLDELQKRLDANSEPINKYENHKNSLIEIKNILYKYENLQLEIELNDLMRFNNDEIKIILKNIMDPNKLDSYYKTYLIYKPLLITYESIKERFGDNFEAPQYNDAIKWLNELLKRINEYLKSENLDENYINALKKENEEYQKYYQLFNNNILVKPIYDYQNFNELLTKMNFNDQEQGEIKKEIGIQNYNLLTNNK